MTLQYLMMEESLKDFKKIEHLEVELKAENIFLLEGHFWT